MNKLNSILILIATLFLCYPLQVMSWSKTYSDPIHLGPEIYYLKRTKEGGLSQSGAIAGIRAGYDHIKRYHLYWGIEGLWATGNLKGKLEDQHYESRFTDANIEARFGYTFQSKCWRCLSFTPFIGIGYFWELNNYEGRSHIHVHFKNTFSYVPVGFFSQIFLTPTFSAGLNFKVRVPLESKQKVTNDPEFDSMTQHYEEKLQYRVEVPLTHFYCWCQYRLATSLIPFYEFRHYGHRANFPFDFLDTKINIYGASFQLLYLF